MAKLEIFAIDGPRTRQTGAIKLEIRRLGDGIEICAHKRL